MSDAPAGSTGQPLLRVVRGTPDEAELAALLAVLAARGGGTDEEPMAATVGGWSDPAHRLRTPLPHGPGAWRASARLR